MNENDIVKAVTFAKNHNLRLVVKGTGNKSYYVHQKGTISGFGNISNFPKVMTITEDHLEPILFWYGLIR